MSDTLQTSFSCRHTDIEDNAHVLKECTALNQDRETAGVCLQLWIKPAEFLLVAKLVRLSLTHQVGNIVVSALLVVVLRRPPQWTWGGNYTITPRTPKRMHIKHLFESTNVLVKFLQVSYATSRCIQYFI